MISLDTNVLVRVLVNDDPAQGRRSAALISSGPVLVTRTVLLETEWVLRYTYRLHPAVIEAGFRKLLGVPNVAVDDVGVVVRALEAYSRGLDFADALHLAGSDGASGLATFDRVFVRAAHRAGTTPKAIPVP